MNLKQLEAFVQVAEGGSFSKAAKELFLTQPTISSHISSLERELNARLFVRNTKEVSLSEDGIKLYKYAKQMLDLQREIEVTFGMDEEGESHAVTIAASTIPAQYLLPEVLTRFSERYPQEQIRIQETDSSKVVMQIVDHRVDIGFTGTVLEKKHCKYIPFYKDELVIITPNTPKYQELAQGNKEDISWIKKEHVIMREEGSGTRKEAELQLKGAGVKFAGLDIIASIENQETIKRSVSKGMGVTILSKLAAEEELKNGTLLAFPLGSQGGKRMINLVYDAEYPLLPAAERFIKMIKRMYLKKENTGIDE